MVSGFLSRQMEFDADRYEARMVGASCFAETMWRFRLMSLAESGAVADVNSSWQQRRLPDNFPKLVMANIPQVPQEVVTAFRRDMETASSELFDTHPSDKDRIARARREAPGDGIFHLDGPATDVFGDFDALAKAVSFDMYRSSLGSSISRGPALRGRRAGRDPGGRAGRDRGGRPLLPGRSGPGPTAADAERIPRGPRRPVGRQAIAGRGARGDPGGPRATTSRRADAPTTW